MIRDYIIKEIFGRGAFGTVYKVLKKSDNTLYVLKKISLMELSKNQLEKAKLESQILSSVKSPYIVRYYESFEEKNFLNIVMEYCDGGDLKEFIVKNKETKILLKENIIWTIFLKILIGLSELHKNKIIHRDLKPLNIFLSKKNLDIKIGDFGVAKILKESNFTNTLIGTPYYLSPELCKELPYNCKSDIWALGVILYELCSYKYPFDAEFEVALIRKILREKPKPINEYYSKNLQNLINLMLDKNFHTRPSCFDILRLPYVLDKLKELGLCDNNIKNNYSNGKDIYDKIDLSERNKVLCHKNFIGSNFINKSYKINNISKYINQVLKISKSSDNYKKSKNGITFQKEPKDNYRNHKNKKNNNNNNNINNQIKSNIDEYEIKIKNERKKNINKYPENSKPNLSILDLDNDEEIFKNIKTTDILNNDEVDKMINIKLTKLKKEKKKINIKDFANFLNNNISNINLTNCNNNINNKTNRCEYRYKKLKDKKFNKIIFNPFNNLYHSNNKIEEKKNDCKNMKKNHSFLYMKHKTNHKYFRVKNGINFFDRSKSALYNYKKK